MKCMKNNFLVFTLLCCSFSLLAQNKIPTVSINPKGMATAKARLSDLIQSIEYIRLETTGNSLIASTHVFDVTSQHIVVRTFPSDDILLFSASGKFMAKIGKKGSGPGEYSLGGELTINEDDKQIDHFVSEGRKVRIISYDLTGKLKKELSIDSSAGYFLRKHKGDGLFMDLRLNNEVESYVVYNLDQHKVIASGIKWHPVKHRNGTSGTGTGPALHYMRNGSFYVRNSSRNDTLYRFNKGNNTFIPYFIFSAGKYDMPDDIRSDGPTFIKRTPEYIFIRSLYETAPYFLFSYEYENRKWYVIYNKSSGQSSLFPSEKGIPNDWDGGPDIWFTRQDEKTMYGFIPASEFLEHKNKLTPKGPQSAIKRMNELKETLLEDDNPVFVVVTMK